MSTCMRNHADKIYYTNYVDDIKLFTRCVDDIIMTADDVTEMRI